MKKEAQSNLMKFLNHETEDCPIPQKVDLKVQRAKLVRGSKPKHQKPGLVPKGYQELKILYYVPTEVHNFREVKLRDIRELKRERHPEVEVELLDDEKIFLNSYRCPKFFSHLRHKVNTGKSALNWEQIYLMSEMNFKEHYKSHEGEGPYSVTGKISTINEVNEQYHRRKHSFQKVYRVCLVTEDIQRYSIKIPGSYAWKQQLHEDVIVNVEALKLLQDAQSCWHNLITGKIELTTLNWRPGELFPEDLIAF